MTNSVFRLRRSSVDLIRKFSLSTGKVPRTSQIAFLGFAIKNLSSSANQDNDFGTARASLFSLHPMRTHSTVPSTKNEAVSTFQSVDATKVSEANTPLAPYAVLSTDDEWWTGKSPQQCAGYKNGVLHSLPLPCLDNCTKGALLEYFDNTWTLTESLFTCFRSDDGFYTPPPHGLRHPLIFYYGHPAALYVNKLRVAGLLDEPVNPYFEKIFETGVDEMSWDDLSNNGVPWPALSEVHSYRKKVYNLVVGIINSIDEEKELKRIDTSSRLWSLVMSFEHERIHLETSSVLLNEIDVNHFKFPRNFPPYHPTLNLLSTISSDPAEGKDYPKNSFIEVPATSVTLGKPRDYPSYSWDNEYGERKYAVPAFKASKFKVSNGEFYEFVKSGGYSDPQYWTTNGWKWRAFKNAKWPQFWILDGPQGLHKFKLRLIFDVVPMQWAWPVTINLHEADAFANWKSKKEKKNIRVITELEHNAIRDEMDVKAMHGGKMIPLDPIIFDPEGFTKTTNSNLAYSSPSSVDYYPPNKKGFFDVFGNSWEWCRDYFSALHGFQVHHLYEDFSTPCFDGEHNVIMGNSFISTGNEASMYSRFHFRPHFLQHASCRYVEQLDPSLEPPTSDTDARGPYVGSYPFRRSKEGEAIEAAAVKEAQKSSDIARYYSPVDLKTFYNSKTNTIKDHILEIANSAGLGNVGKCNFIEVGCGAGNNAIQLASNFRAVIGIDLNGDHIKIAKSVLDGSIDSFQVKHEGEITNTHKLNLKNDSQNSERLIEFRQADPLCLPAELKEFDMVFLNDILDTVSSPNSLLGRMGGERGLVKHGGVLLISSAFQWKDTVTPKQLWLGGYIDEKTGNEVESRNELVKKLSDEFQMISMTQIPSVWTEDMNRNIKGKLCDFIAFVRK